VARAAVAALITADDLLEMPDDGRRYELVAGELVDVSPSASWPGIVASKVSHRIETYIDDHPGVGVCGVAEAGFRLFSNPDTVRTPDVWFIAAAHIRETGIPDGFWPGAPDLAIEVLSPSDRFADVMRKVREYLAAGARRVWLIDLKGRAAADFGPDATAALLDEDGVLEGGEVLPGFTLALRDILP